MEKLRNQTQGMMEELEAQFMKAKGGTDEQKTIVDNYVKLYDAYTRDYKAEVDILNQDVARQKTIAETQRIKKDLEEQPKGKWYEQIDANVIVTNGTIFGTTMAVLIFDKFNISPSRLLKFIPIPR